MSVLVSNEKSKKPFQGREEGITHPMLSEANSSKAHSWQKPAHFLLPPGETTPQKMFKGPGASLEAA